MLDEWIAVEGNIGAGKTHLARKLADELKAGLILEQFETNDLLPLFYEEPERYALAVEMQFAYDRFFQMKRNMHQGHKIITDYTYEKSLLFGTLNLSAYELPVFTKYVKWFSGQLPQPDGMIFIKRPVKCLMANISNRGRAYERAIDASYLERIEAAYGGMIEHWGKNMPVLLVECKKGNEALDAATKKIARQFREMKCSGATVSKLVI